MGGSLNKNQKSQKEKKIVILKEFHWSGPHVMKQGCVKQSS